jgi:hypothetical protein
VPSLPIAAFLAGALLTLLMPVTLLIALSTWYWVFSKRVPVTDEHPDSGPDPSAQTPGPTVTQALPPDPGV